MQNKRREEGREGRKNKSLMRVEKAKDKKKGECWGKENWESKMDSHEAGVCTILRILNFQLKFRKYLFLKKAGNAEVHKLKKYKHTFKAHTQHIPTTYPEAGDDSMKVEEEG
jgi:hypothetical protein